MAQYFRSSDGALHQFPDDASPDEMAAAVEGPTTPQKPFLERAGTYVDNLVRQAADTASFGFADELAAGANSVLPVTKEAKGSYEQNLAAERQRDAKFQSDNPVAATGAQLGGALLTGGAGAAKFVGAKALSAIPRLGRAVLAGGAAGAAAGFGAGEGGLGPRLESAATGGVLGAGTGVAVPYALQFSKGAIQPLVNRLTSAPKLADRKILQAFERDQITPQQVQAQIDQLGPDATIADVGGKNTQGLARAAGNVPGKAKKMAADVYDNRQAGQADRIAADTGKTLSPNTDFHGTIDDLTAAQKAASAPAYEKAYVAAPMPAGQVQPGGHLATLMARPSMRAATQRALRIAAEEGRDPNSLGVDFNAAGDPVFKTVPSWQTLDYVKRGLDDVIEQFRDPTSGKLRLDESGRAINETKQQFLKLVDDLNPDYAAARSAYSGPAQTKDALALGRGIFGKDAEITTKRIASMPEGDKAFFRAGVVRAIKDIVDNTPDGADAVKRLFKKQGMRDKLAAAFPDDASFQKFQLAMDRESRFYQTRGAIGAGSRTAPLAAEMGDLGSAPMLPVVGDVARGNYHSAADRALGMLWSKLGQPSERVAGSLADNLFTMDPEANRALLARLGRRPPPIATLTGKRAAIATGLADVGGQNFGPR